MTGTANAETATSLCAYERSISTMTPMTTEVRLPTRDSLKTKDA